jgi:8-oxo-dGTP pyrophosphatase MutT (NUDIX family)
MRQELGNPPEMIRISSKVLHEGRVATMREDEYRLSDGSTTVREVVAHPGAVVMVAHDGERLYLVRQPRAAVGEEHLLELPAGKLDKEGESPLGAAKRELAEEIGKRAAEWRELKRIYTSPGFTTEEAWIYLATDLSDVEAEPEPDERIEIVGVPLDELDAVIDECVDAESLVGLLLFREMRRTGSA